MEILKSTHNNRMLQFCQVICSRAKLQHAKPVVRKERKRETMNPITENNPAICSRLITKAVLAHGEDIEPCCGTFEESYTIDEYKGKTILKFWYNDKNGSTHVQVEELNQENN